MPARFTELNELSASMAISHVDTMNPNLDYLSVAEGARLTSEVIFRTLTRCRVALPEELSEVLIEEFITAKGQDRQAISEHQRRVRAEEIGGELTG